MKPGIVNTGARKSGGALALAAALFCACGRSPGVPLDAARSMEESERGSRLAKEGRLDEAIAHAGLALRYDPGNAQANLTMSFLMGHKGRLDDALRYARAAAKVQPENSLARRYLRFLLMQKGRLSEEAQSEVNAGVLLAHGGKLDEAITHTKRALEYSPNHVTANFNMAIFLNQKGRLQEAVRYAQVAAQGEPNNINVHFNLAVFLQNLGRSDEAAKQYNAVLALDPNHAASRHNLELIQGTRN